jgi:hypothetical protein
MDPTPFFIMGTMFGCAATLLVQAYGRRKVRKAISQTHQTEVTQEQMAVTEMRRRVEALEQIVTEPQHRLTEEIARLR